MLVLTVGVCLAFAPTYAGATGSGSISGTVTGGATEGQLVLAGPCVAAYDSGGTQVGYKRAGTDGHYTIDNLTTGDYRLEIIDCSARLGPGPGPGRCVGAAAANCLLPGLPSEFYENKRTLAEATPVSVVDGVATTGIDASLGVDGAISGTVTDRSGTPLDGICVEAFYSGGTPAGVAGHTSSGGNYQVNSLGAGFYSLKFSDCLHPEDPSVTTKYLDDMVPVTEDIVTAGIDAQLETKPEPTVYTAAISEVSVKGPAEIKKGKKAIFTVKITNSGNAEAIGVGLKIKGRGVSFGSAVGSVSAASAKTVKVKLKPKRPGKAKLIFKVTSANAGGKSVERRITIRK